MGIESTSYQAALSQQLLSKRAYPIRQIKPTVDKTTRFMSRFTLFENGRVFLPPNHSLSDEFESEFASFPSAAHDDLLDATEIALSLVGYAQMYREVKSMHIIQKVLVSIGNLKCHVIKAIHDL